MKDTQVILEIIKELRADASLNYKKEEKIKIQLRAMGRLLDEM